MEQESSDLEYAIDCKLRNAKVGKWPVFISQAEDFEHEIVVATVQKYIRKGWDCYHKPGGFLFICPAGMMFEHWHDKEMCCEQNRIGLNPGLKTSLVRCLVSYMLFRDQ